jgi:hypothetical protein
VSFISLIIQVPRELAADPEVDVTAYVELAGQRSADATASQRGVTAGPVTVTEINGLDPEWQDYVTDELLAYKAVAAVQDA